MNKYKKLFSNTIIFFIGNFGSKLVSVLLVPLYTFYLTKAEYGSIDILISTVNLLIPIISLSIYEVVLRFIMDSDDSENKKSVLTNSIIVAFSGFFILFLSYFILKQFQIFGENLIFFNLIIFSQIIQTVLSQYTRATNKIKIYSAVGIITTIVLSVSNIYFLVYLKMGVQGYFYSIILSNLVSIFIFLVTTDALKNIKFSKIKYVTIKKMLVYSLPLIPNALMWWLINASNRYFILYFKGEEQNGLFAVASKIPVIISVFITIFMQAWQLSAIEEYQSEDKMEYYSKMFHHFQIFLFLLVFAINLGLKIVFKVAVASDYFIAWKPVPFLLLGAIFSGFSDFWGANYIAAKNTKGIFKTSILGAVIVLASNLLLIPILGITGAAMAVTISFFVIWVLRIIDSSKFMKIQFNYRSLIFGLLLIFVQIVVLFLNIKSLLEILISLFIMITFIFINKNIFLNIWNKLRYKNL